MRKACSGPPSFSPFLFLSFLFVNRNCLEVTFEFSPSKVQLESSQGRSAGDRPAGQPRGPESHSAASPHIEAAPRVSPGQRAVALTFSGQASYGNLRKTLNHDHPWHESLWGRFTDPCEGIVSSHPFSAVTLTPLSVCRQRVLGKPGSKPKEQTLVCSICRCPWCKSPSKAKVKPPTGSHGADVAGTGWACPALADPSRRCTPAFPTTGGTLSGPSMPEKRPLALQGQPPAPRLRRAS